MKIVWLASYPKSGNTWLRFFLYAYLFGDIESSEKIARYLPDIHKVTELNTNTDRSIFVKTHSLFSARHPYIEYSSGAIYIVRHPKDVLLSSLNFCRMEGDWEISDREFAQQFIEHFGVPKWKMAGMGSWPEHIESWVAGAKARNMRLLVLRYEDLLRETEESFSKVISFLGIDRDDQRMERAISQCSFRSLSKLEQSEKQSGVYSPVFTGQQKDSSGHSFMNKGKVGQNLSMIGDELDVEFDLAFEPYLAKYGYVSGSTESSAANT